MNTSNFKHVTEMMQASLPYVNSKSRAHMEVFIKASELMDSFSQTNSTELSACNVSSETIDYEGLFQSLQEISTPKEAETLNTLMNFVKTQKLYHTYQNMKDFLPAGESGNFTRNKLIPMVENFFEAFQKNKERGTMQ